MKTALMLALAAAMSAAADLSGIVVAEHDGTPVVAAAVTLRSGGKVVAELETDDLGIFRAPALPAADYAVTATKSSFTTSERRVALTNAGTDILLQITKLGVISGRVTDLQGNGIRNMAVAAVPVPPGGGPPRIYNTRPKGAATDASGRYRIFGLPAGDYMVVALAGNARSIADVPNGVTADTSHGSTAEFYPSNRGPIVLPIRSGEQHSGIDFRGYTGPLFSIKGTVSGPGPETPYRVSLVSDTTGVPVGSSIAQPGKEFQFDRVAPGTYKVVAARQPSNNIIDLINSGQIVVTAANEAALLRELEMARAAGLTATPPAEPVFAESPVTVVAQDVTGLALSARPGIDAKLMYRPASGCPASVQLTLTPIEYLGLGNTGKKLDAGTELALTGVPSGAYGVTLNLPESSGCYAVTSLIDFRRISPGTAIPIEAARLGSIQGKVDTTGFIPEEYQIVMLAPDGITKRTLTLAKDSTFSIPNLRPGRYRITATRRSASRTVAADQEIGVESGASAQVEFPALP